MISEDYSEDLNLCLYYQKTRDEKVYRQLLNKYSPLLKKKANYVANRIFYYVNSLDFDDVLSEFKICLLKAIDAVDINKVGGDKKAFTLYGLLYNRILTYIRKRFIYYERIEIIEMGEYDSRVYSKRYNHEEYDLMYNHENIIKEFIKEKLNRKQSIVFKLFMTGLTNGQIAKKMKCTPHNISYFTTTVKDKFKRYLDERGYY